VRRRASRSSTPTARPSAFRRLLFLSLAGLLLLNASSVALVGTWLLLYRSERIMPGVHTLGVDLGGRTTSEATALLQNAWQGRAIVLETEEGEWPVAPDVLGLSLDAQAMAEAAYRQGRLTPRGEPANLVWDPISPMVSVDPRVARSNLQELAPRFETPARNADVEIVDGQPQVIPPTPGRTLNVTDTVARLEQQVMQVAQEGRLRLAMEEVQPAVTDVSELVNAVSYLLENPPTIRAYDAVHDEVWVWAIPAQLWTEWLELELDPEGPVALEWSVDRDQVAAFLAERAAILDAQHFLDHEAAVEAVAEAAAQQASEVHVRVYHHEQQHVVQPGETLSSIAWAHGMPYPWIQEANPGIGDALTAGQMLTIPSPDRLLPLPPVENKRILIRLSEQRMWVYEGDQLRWEWPVSTGIPSSPTSPGVFQIQTHEQEAYAANWDLWMPYFMGIYQPVPGGDFMNGFHGFPARNGTTVLWTNHLGRPVTYGCVLVSTENAALLYEWAEDGVVVEILP
jgi:lipoprotein-anchoring transpeptidase ErfK/SrfK